MMRPQSLAKGAENVQRMPSVSARVRLSTLLLCHGNAGNIGQRLESVARLLQTGFQVLLSDVAIDMATRAKADALV
jgi:class 3 adenylate cyclase